MIPNSQANVAVITEQQVLQQQVATLKQAPWIAVDTEFLRESTYYAQLCLVQIGTPDTAVCIDPLALEDLSPLRELFTAPDVIKVFHAAYQDMEILLQTLSDVPRPVFDTQVAAALLGHPDQMGYGRLVEAMLGVQLDKAHARTDWSRRPLEQDVLEYAADDVRYLAQLYPQILTELEQRGRLDWLAPEFRELENPERYRTDPAQAWRRVKGWKRLKPAQQQALAPLAAWREETAISANRPRGWIVKDDVLQEIARRRPSDMSALQKIRGLADGTIKRHGQRLLELIEASRKQPAKPLAETPERLAPDQEPLVDLLMATLKTRAAEADISPGAIAARRDIEQLVGGNEDIALLRGWRRLAAGNLLLEVLAGERGLRARDGKLDIE